MIRMTRQTRKIRTLSGVAAAFLALAGAGCGRDRPVAELEAQPAELRLDYPRFAVLTLTFRITGERPGGPGPLPIVFVHLLDGAGTVVRTFDHPFPAAWRGGATVSDSVTLYQSALAPPLAPGRYRLTVGLYDPERRWPLAGGEEADRREYVAAAVAVGGADPDVPSFHFSESWLPPQPRGEVQILTHRWLSGEGRIRLTGIRQAGTLWLRLRIPPPQFEGFTMTLAAGAAQPAVLVSSGCAGEEVSLSGSGTHDVSLRVDPIEAKKAPAPSGEKEAPQKAAADVPEEDAGGACEISLRPNFSFTSTSGAQALRQSVALEVLAWGAPQPAQPVPAP
jgi:hypothetical protein